MGKREGADQTRVPIPIEPHGEPSREKEGDSERLVKLQRIYEQESSHFNLKTLYIVCMVLFLFVIALFRGDGRQPSVVGVEKCQPLDHVLLALLITGGVFSTIFSAWWVRRDYIAKRALDYPFVQGEMLMTPLTIVKLASIGFVAGFCNAWVGVGSSFVISPCLISMGIFPLVAGNSGVYVSMVNNISSSIIVLIFGRINLAYGLMINLFVCVATFPGAVLARKIVQWTGKRSITVLLMLCAKMVPALINPVLSAITLPKMRADGVDIMAWGSYC